MLALGLFVVLMTPLVAPYLNHDLEQAMARQEASGTAPSDTSALTSLREGFFLALFTRSPEDAHRPFDPGRIALGLLAVLIVSGLIRPQRLEREVFYYALFAVLGLAIAAMTSVRTFTPLSLAVAVLCGIAVRHIERWTRALPEAGWLVWLIPLGLTIDLHPPRPNLAAAIPREGPARVALWLSGTGEAETVAEFPVPADTPQGDVIRARRQLNSIYHWRRLVDGQARRTPPFARLIRHRLAGFPNQVSLAQLRALQVDLAIVHVNEYEPDEWGRIEPRLAAMPELSLEQDLGSARVYRLRWDPVVTPAGFSR